MQLFELGRGAKLTAENDWHQSVLKVDFEHQQKPFLAIELGKEGVVTMDKLSLGELQTKRWNELLKESNCEELIARYARNERATMAYFRSVAAQAAKLAGKWITTKAVEVLDHHSNHGNWVDSTDMPGKCKFEVNSGIADTDTCQVLIPVVYSSGGPGYYPIYQGRFELTLHQLLIWQNETLPVRINYQWSDTVLELELFRQQLPFTRA